MICQKALTSTQQVRKAVAEFRGREFTLLDLKHIYAYASRVANLLIMGEVDELEKVDNIRVFRATGKLKSWDYQHASRTERKSKSRVFHKALKDSAPVTVKTLPCAGWRDVTPHLFSDPYYSIQGRCTSVNAMSSYEREPA